MQEPRNNPTHSGEGAGVPAVDDLSLYDYSDDVIDLLYELRRDK